jgi:hypothetical protein
MKKLGMLILPALLLVEPFLASQSIMGPSPTCGPVNGKSSIDRQNVLTFCKENIVKGTVVGAEAIESLLWIKVSRDMADQMRADRLNTEQIVKNWMTEWRKITGSKAVTVYVKWEDVEIATGGNTALSGDRVTIP